jgi:hypothetical protein
VADGIEGIGLHNSEENKSDVREIIQIAFLWFVSIRANMGTV